MYLYIRFVGSILFAVSLGETSVEERATHMRTRPILWLYYI